MKIIGLAETTSDVISYGDYLNTLAIWLAIVTIFLTVIYGINIHINNKSKKEIDDIIKGFKTEINKFTIDINEMKSENLNLQKKLEKNDLYNEQLAIAIANLQTGGNYPYFFLSNFPDDLLANQIFGMSIYKRYNELCPEEDDMDYFSEHYNEILKALECYNFISVNGYTEKLKSYNLGSVFFDSIINEMTFFANCIIIHKDCYINDYEKNIKLINQSFDSMIKSLDLDSEKDLLLLDFTDIRLMNYANLLYSFGRYLIDLNRYIYGRQFIIRFIDLSYKNELLKDGYIEALDLLIANNDKDIDLDIFKSMRNESIVSDI